MNKISVAMRTHNRERYVAEQLQSIIDQTHQVDEIIISDDKSEDGTVSILRVFQKKYPHLIHIYENDTNKGANKNFEQAVSHCTGDIIFLSDDDDRWHVDKIETILNAFIANPHAQLIFSDAAIIDALGEHTNTTFWKKWGFTHNMQAKWKHNDLALEDLLKNQNKITGASIAIRKELLKKALPMRPDSEYLHDAWLGIVAAREHGLFFIEKPLLDYRVHADQMIGLANASPYPTDERAACTIIAPNYLAQARALTESFIEHHPDTPMYVLIVGSRAESPDVSQELFIPLFVEDLHIPELSAMTKRYNIRELCTSVKPFFLQYIFDHTTIGKICYLDPDIYIYNPLQEIFNALNTNDIVITPHILQPLDEDFLPNEFSILRAGAYNLGCIAVRRSQETRLFLKWWGQRLIHYSHGAPDQHEHFDQRWIDLVPGFFQRVHITRNPGINTAYWDLSNRSITMKNGVYYVNNTPLIFFHFSGYSPLEPEQISKHQNRFTFQDIPPLRSLFDSYAQRLKYHGYIESESVHKKTNIVVIQDKAHTMGPKAYRKLTTYLASKGLEEILTSLLGKSIIANIRTLFFAMSIKRRTPVHILPGKGVNIIGFLQHRTGVGMAATAILRALKHSTTPCIPIDIEQKKYPSNRYNVSIINVNADITQDIIALQQLGYNSHQYNIGYWWWEMSQFPDIWKHSFNYLNEIWVGSTFVRDAIANISPIPVYLLPPPILLPKTALRTRSELGLPKQSMIFLYIFDARSYMERKNPYAIIDAFTKAFPTPANATLVMKIGHADEFQEETKSLRDALQKIQGILIETMMTREDLSSLIALSDAYVSLHRSEGFGFTIAEAMLMGKPVIATHYSGNNDYMTNKNSYPVDYSLIAIPNRIGPYDKGMMWADPNIEHAGTLMRRVYGNYEEARMKGICARGDIERMYGIETTSKNIADRLTAIFEQHVP